MFRYRYLIIYAIVVLFGGCSTVVVEQDGVPVGGREGLVMINPAGQLLSDVKSVAEVTYEKTVNQKDSSCVTLGFGEDDRDGNDTTALYLLAGGRYYPMGRAPEGFFIQGDLGIGYFDYNLTDNTDTTFLYGIGLGYKYLLGMVVLDLGAAYMKMDYKEDESEYVPVARAQLGITF